MRRAYQLGGNVNVCACVRVPMCTVYASNTIAHRRSTYYSLFMFCQRKNWTEQLLTSTCRCRYVDGTGGRGCERWTESGIQLYMHVLNKYICIQSEIMFSIPSYRSFGWTQLIMWCVYVHMYMLCVDTPSLTEWMANEVCEMCTK